MSRAKGDRAEGLACDFLMAQGCRIIDRNVYSKFGEIDIVAEKSGVLHFVEVKSGVGFDPVFNITPTKMGRLLRTIQVYLKKECYEGPWQVDALIVQGDGIEWIENITM